MYSFIVDDRGHYNETSVGRYPELFHDLVRTADPTKVNFFIEDGRGTQGGRKVHTYFYSTFSYCYLYGLGAWKLKCCNGNRSSIQLEFEQVFAKVALTFRISSELFGRLKTLE